MNDRQWVVCPKGEGFLMEEGEKAKYITNFPMDSVGIVRQEDDSSYWVWLIGNDKTWVIPKSETAPINVLETGDKFDYKICNICHCLKPVSQFAKNQNNIHGVVRRPSCQRCRSDIDKRPPRSQQAKDFEKKKPKKGSAFKCPICTKRSIVGVTAKIVADHDHHTGNIRDYICDSCNTGLGRFKNGENYLMNAVNYIKARDTLRH